MIPSQIKSGSQYLKKREKFIAVVAGVSPAKVKRKECSQNGCRYQFPKSKHELTQSYITAHF